jgi:hypothetical protein
MYISKAFQWYKKTFDLNNINPPFFGQTFENLFLGGSFPLLKVGPQGNLTPSSLKEVVF